MLSNLFNKGIWMPNLTHRFQVQEIQGLEQEDHEALIKQTISFSYREDRSRSRCLIEWVVEDDCAGFAAKALEHFPSPSYFSIINCDGQNYPNCTLKFLNPKILIIDYVLDYAESGACKFLVTMSADRPIREWPRMEESRKAMEESKK